MHTELVPAAIGTIFTVAVFAIGFAAGGWHASRKRDKVGATTVVADDAIPFNAEALYVGHEGKPKSFSRSASAQRPYSERENAWDARHGEVNRG